MFRDFSEKRYPFLAFFFFFLKILKGLKYESEKIVKIRPIVTDFFMKNGTHD